MINKFKYVIVLGIVAIVLSGCAKVEDFKVKAGIKNNDFEYIKQGKIEKIIIQNTRDKGFRFIVTDKGAITELYDILSTAKEAKEKSFLDPDYIFEMQESPSKVYKFNYIAGLDKKDDGNLYSGDKVYIVSKRIDNDIVNNFWNIRKPKDFQKTYYGSILQLLEKDLKDIDKNKKIGINIEDDVEAAKFILSTNLEEFKGELKDKIKNAELIEKGKDDYDIKVTLKTQGYRATLYKCIATVWNKEEKSEKKYYIENKYNTMGWEINIYTDKPEKF